MGKAKRNNIEVQGTSIQVISRDTEDYISLTDMAKRFGDDVLIYSWMRNRNTLEFIGVWEKIHNANFKGHEFETFRKQAGLNAFSLTPRKWIEGTDAIGFVSRAGRYGGGTYAHKDIAFEFGSWLSPEFKLYLIKEFQRLKDDESERLKLDWNLQRVLSKINYRIHTDAVRDVCDGTPLRRGTPAEGLASEGHLRRDTCGGTPAEGHLWRDSFGGTRCARDTCSGNRTTPSTFCRITAQGFSPGYAEGGNIEGLSLTAQGFSPGYAEGGIIEGPSSTAPGRGPGLIDRIRLI
jgi:hypothetical protein